jgi:hypothetical protein
MTLPLFALGLALLSTTTGPAPAPPAAAPVTIEARGDRLTVRAREVSLRLILERIGEIARITVHIEAPTEERITVEFQDVPLEEALRRLLRHRSAVLIYETVAGPLVSVRVVRPASLTDSPSLGGPDAVETAVGEDHEARPSDAAGGEPIDPGAIALARASAAVDVVEEEIQALPGGGESLNVYRFMDRLNDPEPSVRVTALQWLVTRAEAQLTALASALKDSDAGVRAAAAQMILDREVSEEAVQQVMAAAETADPATVVGLLHQLLTP